MKKSRFDFATAVTAELCRIGTREGGTYDWQLDTVAGLLDIHPYDDWIAWRFEDGRERNRDEPPSVGLGGRGLPFDIQFDRREKLESSPVNDKEQP